MSFIVPGFYKPQACERWKNGKFARCWFLDEYDNCRLLRDGAKFDLQEQYAVCPLIRIKRNHGELIDAVNGDFYLQAEKNDWKGW